MIVERRKSKRLDMCIIVEFKVLQSSMSSLGITRDFAGDGFSFESQDLDVEPGESLDFRFKNAESNLYVSAAGAIVWKKRNSEFGYLIGIRFNEIDDETRMQMYEAVSAMGHVPLNYLTDDNGYEGEYRETTKSDDYTSMYYDPADKDEADGIEPVFEKGSPQDSSLPEEQLTLDAEDGKDGDYAKVKERSVLDHTFPVKIDRRIKKPLYEPIVKIIILLLLLLAAIFLFGERGNIEESLPEQVLQEPVIVEEIEPIQPEQPIIIEEPPISQIVPPTAEAPFLVQVGAWKNPEYSNEMLPRLKEYYPGAYIVVVNNFHIIRIPGVMHREQGGIMLRDIKDKFNLKGLVITNR